jgi:hypothetical protein
MEEVNPLELIPGETYYLEEKRFDIYYKENGFSSRGKGEFVKYEENVNGTSAKFKNIESVNNKPFHFLPDSQYRPNISTFHVAPYGSGYRIYKIKEVHLQAREDEKARVKAFEKMINQEKLPIDQDKISTSTMFAETPQDIDPTFYGTEPDKSSLGTQLKNAYGSSLLNKKTAGRRRRKTRKSRKSRKMKSRRRR